MAAVIMMIRMLRWWWWLGCCKPSKRVFDTRLAWPTIVMLISRGSLWRPWNIIMRMRMTAMMSVMMTPSSTTLKSLSLLWNASDQSFSFCSTWLDLIARTPSFTNCLQLWKLLIVQRPGHCETRGGQVRSTDGSQKVSHHIKCSSHALQCGWNCLM